MVGRRLQPGGGAEERRVDAARWFWSAVEVLMEGEVWLVLRRDVDQRASPRGGKGQPVARRSDDNGGQIGGGEYSGGMYGGRR
jgi:hypothetical protein